MSRYYRSQRGGRRPTGGNQPPSGYFTDPERDQERGGNWGPPSEGNWGPPSEGWGPTGEWIGEERTTNSNTNTTNRNTSGWTNTQPRRREYSPTSRPAPFASQSPPFNTPLPIPSTSTTWTNPSQGGWPQQQPPIGPRGPTAMTDRIFDDAMTHTRGRGSYRGIRPMSTTTPRITGGVNLDEPTPPYSGRRRYSPDERSPDAEARSLIDRVRKAGVITDADDKQIGESSRQIIDDLLFMLDQSDNRNQRLANQVKTALKKKRIRDPEDNHHDNEDSRLTKRRDPNTFANTPSQTSTPSSVGLALEFDKMRTEPDNTRAERERRPEPPRNQGDTDMPAQPRGTRTHIVRLTPPGPMSTDPVVNSDPRTISRVNPDQPSIPNDLDESDETDYEDMTDKQKKKYDNSKAERERSQLMIALHRLDVRIPPFWEVRPLYGMYERDNTLRNMLSEQFYVSRRNNTVYHRIHQGAQIVIDDRNAPSEPRGNVTQKFDKASPKGLPRTAWEVKCLVQLLHDSYGPYYDRVLAYIFLREMHYIARGVIESIRDHAMEFIMTPGVYDPNYMPNFTTTADLLPRSLDPGKPPGVPNLGSDHALNIDEMARYIVLYGRPGPNFHTGVVIDYAYRVNRRSVFGYGLIRALSPDTKSTTFRRYAAAALALPRRYREVIEDYNTLHPSAPFAPQTGPTYEITRLPDANTANMNLQSIFDLMISNRIPPAWVDHGYTYGLNFLNHQYPGSSYVPFFDEIDNERIVRVSAYGVPPAIPEWDGWRHPTDEDMQRIRQLNANRASREAPGFDHRLERGWVRVGEDGLFPYLEDRVQVMAELYRDRHPIHLPSYPTLDPIIAHPGLADTNMSAVGAADTNMSAGDSTPMEVEASANTEASTSSLLGTSQARDVGNTKMNEDSNATPPSA
jgi:hypothetical protein